MSASCSVNAARLESLTAVHPIKGASIRQAAIVSLLCAMTFGSVAPVAAEGYRTPAHRFTEYGEVVDVRPRYRDVSMREPYRDCWIEERTYGVREGYAQSGHYYAPDHVARAPRDRRGSAADVVVGSVIGGVIGNQLGRHSSRDRRTGATIAGAVIGGAIGNEVGERRHRTPHYRPHRHYAAPVPVTTPVETCRDSYRVRYQERLDGYEVTYRYRGETFTTVMSRDPGDRVELAVSVRPARH